MSQVQGWGGGRQWKLTCEAINASPLQGWGGGSQWRMHRAAAGQRIEGNDGGAQWKLFCQAAQPPQ